WSACSSKEYGGSETTREKVYRVPIEYEGEAQEVTLGMLHSRARRRAEKNIRFLYSHLAGQKNAQAFQGLPIPSLRAHVDKSDGPYLKGDEPIPPGSLKPEDGINALEYLLFCWGEKTYKQAIEGRPIPKHVLDKVLEQTQERRERIDLNDRILVEWDGKNL